MSTSCAQRSGEFLFVAIFGKHQPNKGQIESSICCALPAAAAAAPLLLPLHPALFSISPGRTCSRPLSSSRRESCLLLQPFSLIPTTPISSHTVHPRSKNVLLLKEEAGASCHQPDTSQCYRITNSKPGPGTALEQRRCTGK